MSLVLHASDLRFGKADENNIQSLYHEIERQKPDLVVLSGDFTQIGSRNEFILAKDFIGRITAPVFCVPGNHDIPRYHPWVRFTDPMKRYRDYIQPMQDTVYEDDSLFVVGINTARAALPHWNWANGMISQEQVEFVYRQFCNAPPHKARLFVCHHPLVNVKDSPIDTVVWGSTDMMGVLQDQNVDIVLTGHIHHASVLDYGETGGPLMLGSGSTTSTRLRSQSNGYNILRVFDDKVDVELIHWDGRSHQIFETMSKVRAERPEAPSTHDFTG